MLIIYTPADGPKEEFDIRSLRTSEASIVQRTIDLKWAEVQQGIDGDDPEVLRGVAWVLKKRTTPSLRFSEFDPVIGELVTRMDRQEVAEWLKNAFALAEQDEDVSREQVAAICQRVVGVAADPEHAERLVAEMSQDPKEPTAEEQPEQPGLPEEGESPSSSTPTSTSSGASGSGSSRSSSTSRRKTSTS